MNLTEIKTMFDPTMLKWTCEAEPRDIMRRHDMTLVAVDQIAPHDFYLFADRGASVLAVAHLDTVHQDRTTVVVDTAAGPVVHSGALDDRLGAYVLGELLPALGMEFDLLFTVGEEHGMSTAAFFDPTEHHDRDYDWIIEFDRGGTDVVLYQYEDRDLVDRVEATGVRVNAGAFSDISFLEHLGVKAMNWGVGYRDYHGPRGHAWLDDTFRMVEAFADFHDANAGVRLDHEVVITDRWWGASHSTDDGYEYEDGVCAERDDDQCEGALVDTNFGPMCAEHRSWYVDEDWTIRG